MLIRPRHRRPARSVAPLRRDPVDRALVTLLDVRATWVCRIEAALAPLGLSSTAYTALSCLRDTDGLLSQLELEALLSAKRSSAADRAIQSLLAQGLIEPVSARPGADSGQIRLTATGLSRHLAGARALDEVSGQFAAMIPDADRAVLDRIVSRVHPASD